MIVPESSMVVRPETPGTPNYTASSRLQAAGLQEATDVFVGAAGSVPLPKAPAPIVIADYGAGNGHNALLPIAAAIERLRGRTPPEQAVLVAHTDVAGNDFTALFEILDEDPDSYLHKDPAVYVSAVGRSFYQQILPSESIALGWSSWATHWLSRVPAPIGDHIHIAFSADAAAQRAYARQAAVDWHDFLAFRGREMAPGGRLVVLTLGVDAAGRPGFDGALQALLAALRHLVAEGALTESELHRMVVPTVGRTEKEFLAPFAPSGSLEGLSVEHLELFDAEDRFWTRFQGDGDAEGFGARWAAFARAAVFPTLLTALNDETDLTRSAAIVGRVESELAARLAASPQPMPIPLAGLLLRKRPRFS